MRTLNAIFRASALALCAVACSSAGGGPDGGEPDGGEGHDAGTHDAGVPDAGPILPPDGGHDAVIEIFLPGSDFEIRQGAEQVAHVNVHFDATLGAAAITVAGAQAGLTALADPAQLTELFGFDLVLRAAPDAATTTRTLTLHVAVGDQAKELEFHVKVTAFEGVDGTVVDQYGQPVRSALVRVGEATTLTDASGRFVFTRAAVPYDLDILLGDEQRGYRFAGLQRRDPVAQLAGALPVANAWAIEGRLSGGFVPPPADASFAMILDAPRARPEGQPLKVTGDAFDNSVFTFFGGPATSGTLWVLEGKRDATGQLASFYAVGHQFVSAVAGQRSAGQRLALTPVGTGNVSGTITVPEGYTISDRRLWLSMGGDAGLALGGGPGGPDFSYPVPQDRAFRASLVATASFGPRVVEVRRIGLAPDSSGVSLVLPTPPVITVPQASGAVLARDASFTWTDDAAGVVYVATFGGTEPGDPSLVVVTGDKRAQVPDFTALGLDLPAEVPLTFGLLAAAPYASVDEAAGRHGLRYDHLLPSVSGHGADHDGTVAVDKTSFRFPAAP